MDRLAIISLTYYLWRLKSFCLDAIPHWHITFTLYGHAIVFRSAFSALAKGADKKASEETNYGQYRPGGIRAFALYAR